MTANAIRFYTVFCIFRVLNVFLIQSQFDPDEYWQQLEPAYCRVFVEAGEPCAGLTWEWKRKPASTDVSSLTDYINVGMQGPVRSYTSILPTLVFYHAIKYVELDTPWMVSRGPVFLNAILVAAPTDLAVWYLSQYLGTPARNARATSIDAWCLYCCLSSWFLAYSLVRTYSNCLETVILAFSLCLVSPELLGPVGVKASYRLQRSCLAFFLGGISCSIRFTSLAAFVPMGLLLSIGHRPRSVLSALNYLLCVCATYGLLGIFTTLLLDRELYGFPAIPILGSINFNVILGNGSLYGTHPVHWYLTAGIPAISGILLPFLAVDLSLMTQWSRARRNLWIICCFYIAAHSFSEHKEFRFLLPILPLFCLLSGDRLRGYTATKSWGAAVLTLGILANQLVVVYLGLLHQRAPIEVNRRIIELVKHEPQKYTIHYLMECHSTPLLSHLHSPPIKFEPWTLDCSPGCRTDPTKDCESDTFAMNPGKFMEDTYFHCSDFEEGACVTDLRIFYPDFLVACAGDLPAMQARITTMGMKEVGRFVNGVNGLRISNWLTLGAEALDKGSTTNISLWNDFISFSLDELVLFENRQINPRY